MKRSYKSILLSFILIVVLSSYMKNCKKTVNMPACTGNCQTLTINGIAWDKINNTPVKGVVVSVFEHTPSNVSNNYMITTMVSDANGVLYYSGSVDTTIFNHSYVEGYDVYDTANYIESPQNNYTLMDFMYDTLHQLINNPKPFKLEFYPKTKMTVRLHRTGVDTFSNFHFYSTIDTVHYFCKNITNINGYVHAKDTSCIFESTYNIPTYIYSQKSISSKPFIYNKTKDSIVCNKNGTTVFDLYY